MTDDEVQCLVQVKKRERAQQTVWMMMWESEIAISVDWLPITVLRGRHGISLWWLRETGSREKKKVQLELLLLEEALPCSLLVHHVKDSGLKSKGYLALLLQMAPSVHWVPAYCSILALRANPKWWSSTRPWVVRMGEVMERSSTEYKCQLISHACSCNCTQGETDLWKFPYFLYQLC